MLKRSALLCLICLVLPLAAQAETLDQASVQRIYTEMSGHFADSAKNIGDMQARLDDTYMVTIHLTMVVGASPPQNKTMTLDKAGAIKALKDSENMKTEAQQTKIVAFKLSEDQKFAYITDSTTSSGKIETQGPNGETLRLPFTEGQGCLDMATLVDGKIKLLKSECNTQLTVQK